MQSDVRILRNWSPVMDAFVKAFIKASLVWLVLGVSSGVTMAVHPMWTVFRPAHVHMVALGFVTMMIYGVAYHVIPRFSGFPLPARRAPMVHWWMSNAGLVLLIGGVLLRASGDPMGTPVLAVGGSFSAFGAYVFAWLIWRTIDGSAPMRAAARRAHERTSGSVSGLPLAR